MRWDQSVGSIVSFSLDVSLGLFVADIIWPPSIVKSESTNYSSHTNSKFSGNGSL